MRKKNCSKNMKFDSILCLASLFGLRARNCITFSVFFFADIFLSFHFTINLSLLVLYFDIAKLCYVFSIRFFTFRHFYSRLLLLCVHSKDFLLLSRKERKKNSRCRNSTGKTFSSISLTINFSRVLKVKNENFCTISKLKFKEFLVR